MLQEDDVLHQVQLNLNVILQVSQFLEPSQPKHGFERQFLLKFDLFFFYLLPIRSSSLGKTTDKTVIK